MESIKNPRQTEFCLLKDELGWSAAEIARALSVSKAAVSQILSGKSSPRETTLAHLRRVVQDVKNQQAKIEADPNFKNPPSGDLMNEGEKLEIIEKMGDLALHAPRHFETVITMIDGLHSMIPKENRTDKPDADHTKEIKAAITPNVGVAFRKLKALARKRAMEKALERVHKNQPA